MSNRKWDGIVGDLAALEWIDWREERIEMRINARWRGKEDSRFVRIASGLICRVGVKRT